MKTPLVSKQSFSCQPKNLYNTVHSLLQQMNAHITAKDDQEYFIAWCHFACDFVTLKASSSGERSYNWGGIVYATARIKPWDSGSVVYLHSTMRNSNIPDIEFSDGTYEKILLEKIESSLITSAESH